MGDSLLTVVGTNHRRAPIDIRERLSCHPEALTNHLRTLLRESVIMKEAVILSTCNRTEIYTVSTNDHSVPEFLTSILSEWSHVDAANLKSYLYSYTNEEAVQHLIEVASGLDSLIVGERQIQSQIKDAVNLAVQAGTVGRFLFELFHYAYRNATVNRKLTGLGTEGASVSSAAMSLLRDLARKQPVKTILLIGAGKMISIAANDLSAFPESEIWVTNRTFERAKELAARLGGKPLPFDRITEGLQEADAVLTCTAANDYIVSGDIVKKIMAYRQGKPLILVDTAVPRNIDPASERVSGVQLYNIDHLSPIVMESQASYGPRVAEAKDLAHKETNNFYARLRAEGSVDTLKGLRKFAEEIRKKELSRAMRRLDKVSDREKEIIDLLTRRIVNKILYEPTAKLKEHASNGDGEGYEDAIRELFAIDRENK